MRTIVLMKYQSNRVTCQIIHYRFNSLWHTIVNRIANGNSLIQASVKIFKDPSKHNSAVIVFSAVVPSSEWETAIRLKSHEWAEITEQLDHLK